MKGREVYILSYARTPIGSFQGILKSLSAPMLGALAIEGAIKKVNFPKKYIEEVIMGNVLSAGLGQAPARQSAIYANLAKSVDCLTINKMCGSGLKSIMIAAQSISSGEIDVAIAGGMESMSNAPHYLFKAREGYRLGHKQIIDGIIQDGLWDVYNDKHMGTCAEMCAERYSFSRKEQDAYAAESYRRAISAIESGFFENEIVPVEVPQRKEKNKTIRIDEEPYRAKLDKFSKLSPVFQRNGTVTAANASSINDGAAACLLISGEKASSLGLSPIFKINSFCSLSQEPEWFTTAPIGAMKKLFKKTNLKQKDIDLYEINEAFSVVPMAAMKDLSLDHKKVNVNGGAVSIGHPIGSSGTRIIITLMNSMMAKNYNTGMASICIGGGEASAMILEKIGNKTF
ncbi:MAG: acetyl-CoA C-acyltransferase [Candidatus Neomarinimicrobiota bacterium]|nr:acetyl-CoA C-acyltransferase [Candidatus Neomarinimicrobiota bacterium]